jgi:hypothetical protein
LDADARAIPVTQSNIARTSTGFNAFASTDNGISKNYILVEDITLTGTNNWTPIAPQQGNPFRGTFNGNNKTITGLNISGLLHFRGMFAALGDEGIIRDLNLDLVNISGSGHIGGIVGTNYGSIVNCTVTGTITGTKVDDGSGTYIGDDIGGIAGFNGGTIERCLFEGNITGSSNVGGIVGINEDGTIEDCASTGSIAGTDNVGGIAGASEGTIRRCYATGSISGNNSVGGIVGRHDGGSVDNCVALNTGVTSNPNPAGSAGRIVGQQTSGAGAVELANNYASVKILIDDEPVSGGYQNNKNGSDITEQNYTAIWASLGFIDLLNPSNPSNLWWTAVPGRLPDLSQYLVSASFAMFEFDECFMCGYDFDECECGCFMYVDECDCYKDDGIGAPENDCDDPDPDGSDLKSEPEDDPDGSDQVESENSESEPKDGESEPDESDELPDIPIAMLLIVPPTVSILKTVRRRK